jgi:hypothetical protein
MAEDKPPRERRTITFGEASALLAVVGVGVYVLGLLALRVPLSRTYTGDYAASWYAVSLVPRTTVVGQGLVLLGFPLLLTLVASLLFVFQQLGVMAFGSRFAERQAIAFALGLTVVALAASAIIILLAPLLPEFSVLEWALLGLPAALVWGLAYWTRTIQLSRGGWLPEVTSARALWRLAVFGLAPLVFVVAFTIAATRGEPPLSAVQIDASTRVEGKLLAHVDRFWYVFDEHGTLVAVPNREVTEVRISSR